MNNLGTAVVIGAILLIILISLNIISAKRSSPRNREAAYASGINCGNRLIAGCCDNDVRRLYDIPITQEVTREQRAKYGVSRLEESADFGHTDAFDEGYGSVVRPFYNRVVTDD